MADRTIRTIGALVILGGIAVAALIQVVSAPEETPPEIVATDDSKPVASASQTSDTAALVTAPQPFVYRVGVLAGVSTDNYWAFYGEQPSVWNSYILGPTKPALMSVDPETRALDNELIAHADAPVWDAEGWRVRLTLRDDFEWSDGTPITAHDIVFTFDTVRDLGLLGSWGEAFPATVESIHADDTNSLRIEFLSRPQLAVWPHGVGLAPIMPAHVWRPKTSGIDANTLYALSGSDDVGGGQLSLRTVNEALVISSRNEGYPLTTGPDLVEYHVYPDDMTLAQALTAGDIDTILTPRGLAAEQLASLQADPNVTVVASQGHGVRYLGFNLAREPMEAPQFRKAVALLLDRDQITAAIPAIDETAYAFVPEANTSWYDSDQATQIANLYRGPASERLAEALKGLKTAGYTWATEPVVNEDGLISAGNGLEVNGREPQPLTILTTGDLYDPARPDYVTKIASTIELLGFDVRPVETDFDTVVDLAFTPDEDGSLHYDMYFLGWTLGSPAYPGYYRPLFESNGELNNTGYSSKAFIQLLDRYESAHSLESARAALWDMEAMLAADLPYLVLYHSRINEAYRSDRVTFDVLSSLGGIQARLGGISDVNPVN